ncbi:MAG: hypothetical protein KVP17_003702 [Porospora cf. gigantea B]|uniref:uncharacterized protein n=1 Tax=Porospora cf. gigantea B TaxID=2853592 RepID=UPI003571B2A5|nr:MAG: hypothetical protein KVP17_003702 [Porospora cf. gigantea B]
MSEPVLPSKSAWFLLAAIAHVFLVILVSRKEMMAPMAFVGRQEWDPNLQSQIENFTGGTISVSASDIMSAQHLAQMYTNLSVLCSDGWFESSSCDLQITGDGFQDNPKWPHLCDSEVIDEMIEGTMVPRGELPPTYVAKAKLAGVPTANIAIRHPLFDPFYTTDIEKGPISKLEAKIDLLLGETPVEVERLLSPLPIDTRAGRNHHYDFLFRCRPSKLTVTFHMGGVDEANALHRSRVTLTAATKAAFLGMWDVSLDHEEVNVGVYPAVDLPLALVLAVLLAMGPVWDVLASLTTSPVHLLRLQSRRGSFKSHVFNLLDVRGRRQMKPIPLLLENLSLLFMIAGFSVGFLKLFRPHPETFFSEGATQSGIEYILQKYGTQKPLQMLAHLVGESVTNAPILHVFASVFAVARAVMLVAKMSMGVQGIVLALVLSASPMSFFCVVYFLAVLVFAMFARAQLGATFPQYHSVGRAFHTMLFYSLGLGDDVKATENFFQMVEKTAEEAVVIHVLSFVILVILLFNVFTGIAMNCYSLCMDILNEENSIERIEAVMWYRAKVAFGFEHDTEEEIKFLGGKPTGFLFRAMPPLDELIEFEDTEERPRLKEMKADLQAAVNCVEELEDLVKRVRQ